MREQYEEQHSKVDLIPAGIRNVNNVYWNLHTSALYEEAIRRHEGIIAHLGPLVVRTGHHTGRSPNDKFLVKEPTSEEHIWWGKVASTNCIDGWFPICK